ncbi:MAG: hypothetical protein MZV63_32995 [Marinilabiliales bacterium]|nr:hypothetical protein [Marinilabiliales bacterium]
MIESHIDPASALSDKKQQVTPSELIEMLEQHWCSDRRHLMTLNSLRRLRTCEAR